ncbi:MAG: fumarylacetoacetate hydrolase family protein [Mycobacteriales bacterium]
MRWCSFTTSSGGPARLGAPASDDSGRVLDVAVWARSRHAETPPDLVDLLESSAATQQRVADLVRTADEDARGWVRGEEVTYLAPLRSPNSLRVAPAGGAYYKGNRRTVLGPDEPVCRPRYASALEPRLRVGAVVGRRGRDLVPGSAAGHVFGFVLVNDWTAPDVLATESELGPAKASDFATSLGPWLVTPDDWDPAQEHAVAITVDGQLRHSGKASWSFDALMVRAADGEDLWPTDVLVVGAGGEPGVEVSAGQQVTLEVDGLGVLTTPVVHSLGV